MAFLMDNHLFTLHISPLYEHILGCQVVKNAFGWDLSCFSISYFAFLALKSLSSQKELYAGYLDQYPFITSRPDGLL